MSDRILLPVSAPDATEEQQHEALDRFRGLDMALVSQEVHDDPVGEGKLLYCQDFRLFPWGTTVGNSYNHGHIITQVRHTPDQLNPHRVTFRVWYVPSPGHAVELDFQSEPGSEWECDLIEQIKTSYIMANVATAAFSKRP